jgi:hypothetical protein
MDAMQLTAPLTPAAFFGGEDEDESDEGARDDGGRRMRSGCCRRCRRPLHDPVSVAVGMGPVCSRKAGVSRAVAAREGEEGEDELALPSRTADYVHEYRGYGGCVCRCRVVVFEPEGQRPAIVVSELADNPGTSVTNMAEVLAAELIARHFPERVGEPDGVVWIERYPRVGRLPHRPEGPVYARVEFASWAPRTEQRFGANGRYLEARLGTPNWRSLSREELAALLGAGKDGA